MSTPSKHLIISVPDLDDYRKWKPLAIKHCKEAWEKAHPKRRKGRPSEEELVFQVCGEIGQKISQNKMAFPQNDFIQVLSNHQLTGHLSKDTIKKHVRAWIEHWPSWMWPSHKLRMNPTRARQVDRRLSSFLTVNQKIYWPWLLNTFEEMKEQGKLTSVNEFCDLEKQGAISPPANLQKQMNAAVHRLLKNPS